MEEWIGMEWKGPGRTDNGSKNGNGMDGRKEWNGSLRYCEMRGLPEPSRWLQAHDPTFMNADSEQSLPVCKGYRAVDAIATALPAIPAFSAVVEACAGGKPGCSLLVC